ncbi:hypothetical protein [Winogradskya humida]|uniref:Uncharacterized protein n=1 Tax=Winogradskya humida TaxID=113566 RepID=A0ABQ3ZTX5_9ACTN|nr:hypothetical protein [Actinoplanes humidus]GIE22055.1 hypothetical protein Ahu01nite_051570 [Actinoplanes humidus]
MSINEILRLLGCDTPSGNPRELLRAVLTVRPPGPLPPRVARLPDDIRARTRSTSGSAYGPRGLQPIDGYGHQPAMYALQDWLASDGRLLVLDIGTGFNTPTVPPTLTGRSLSIAADANEVLLPCPSP